MKDLITIKVWHGIRHDDATVTEIAGYQYGFSDWIDHLQEHGGFFCPTENNKGHFIPIHRINYVEWEIEE